MHTQRLAVPFLDFSDQLALDNARRAWHQGHYGLKTDQHSRIGEHREDPSIDHKTAIGHHA